MPFPSRPVVVFTSDHGDCLGDHGHIQKWSMYESVVRVPAIVWTADGRFGRNRRVADQCQLFDFGPTLLELAGISPPADFEARSLLPLLRRQGGARGRDHVFAEHNRDSLFEGADLMTMVRSPDWKLVHFHGPEGGQLFDLKLDPNELVNRWDDPRAAAAKSELLAVESSRLSAAERLHAPG